MHTLLLQSLFPLLLITSFLSINVELSLCQDNEQYTNCSEAINCGGIGGISYPFWGVNRANYCGLPGFEVKCLENAPMINMSNVNYRILKTDSSAPSVTVARQDYWGTICPQTYVNTSINFSLFNYPSGLTNLTFYYACNSTVPGLEVNFTSQVCSTNNGDIAVWSFTRSLPVDVAALATRACTAGVSVPVFTTAALALEANRTTIQEVVDEGFELGLEIDNVECNSCVESGGKCGHNATGGFSCFCLDQAYAAVCNATAPRAQGKKKDIAMGLATGFYVMVIILCSICIWWKRNVQKSLPHISSERMVSFVQKDKRDEFDVEAFIRNYGSLTPKRYTYENVKKMTDSFRDKIGKGGYGTVYKGRLPDGLLVAVKVLSESNGNGGEDFINEVASIGRTSHVNIVTLSGFCYEGDNRALIYEYMPNGSLDKFIHKHGSGMTNFRLEWKTLSEIAVGIARGLEYLHRGCNTRILHFDIKPQNILLDKDFRPKISDFGLAKLCKTKDSIVSMIGARGTAGYIAPEVFSRNFGGVSHKSDVYSYGMLVLEMVGAKNNLDLGVSHTGEIFPHHVYKDLELEKDENAYGAITEEEKEIARKMVLISLWCIQTIPSDRPSMSKVVEMLEGPLHSLRIAPKPFLFSPTIAAEDCMTTTSGGSTMRSIAAEDCMTTTSDGSTMGSMVSDGPMAALEMASRSHVGLGSHGRRPHGEEDMQAVREKIEGGRKGKEREEEEEDND